MVPHSVLLPIREDLQVGLAQNSADEDKVQLFVFKMQIFVPDHLCVDFEILDDVKDDKTPLLVTRVLPESIIEAWNKQCFDHGAYSSPQGPDKAIRQGDLVTMVNGRTGNDAISALKAKHLLNITISRREPTSELASFLMQHCMTGMIF